MVGTVNARLIGGPLAGFTDRLELPVPDLVTVAYCGPCGRPHLHVVLEALGTGRFPAYVREPGLDQDGSFGYLWISDAVDDAIAAIMHEDGVRAARVAATVDRYWPGG